jgi:erythromycin esterase
MSVTKVTRVLCRIGRWSAVVLLLGIGCVAARALEQDAVAWIEQNAIVLDTVEFVDGHEDLLPLIPLFADARIVALGEGTHGTREFFTIRLRLMELLVDELGFEAFAFEFPYGEGREVNDYVRSGIGDPAEILARVYCPPWNHQEMLDLIGWMRSYNSVPGRTRTLSFHGIDIHDGSSILLIDSILRFIETVDPSQMDEFADALDCFRYRSMYDIARYSDSSDACLSDLTWVADQIAANGSRYVGRSTTRAYEMALHEARLLLQRAEFYTLTAENPEAADDTRDAYMAENLAWLVDSLGTSERVAVSAHNYHVGRFRDHVHVAGTETRTQTSMGWHLSEWYGDEYVILATTTRTGEVAIFPFPGSDAVSAEETRGLPQHDIVDVPRLRYGAIVDLMRAAEVSPCVLDLRVDGATSATKWLFEDRALLHFGTMFIPSIGTSYMIQVPVAALFDLLIYIDHTTAPHVLPWTPREALGESG